MCSRTLRWILKYKSGCYDWDGYWKGWNECVRSEHAWVSVTNSEKEEKYIDTKLPVCAGPINKNKLFVSRTQRFQALTPNIILQYSYEPVACTFHHHISLPKIHLNVIFKFPSLPSMLPLLKGFPHLYCVYISYLFNLNPL